MTLDELNIGKRVRCVCGSCKGTGIYKGMTEKDDLGVICYNCNGTGNYILNIEDNMQLVRDNQNGVVYVVEDGVITHSTELFEELKRREDVNYVMYATSRVFSPTWLFEHGASEINVIRYEEFLNGMLPLPMREYTCPGYMIQNYGNNKYNTEYNCYDHGAYGSHPFSDCSLYGTMECWDKFYGDAKTIEEKQNVLRMINKSKF